MLAASLSSFSRVDVLTAETWRSQPLSLAALEPASSARISIATYRRPGRPSLKAMPEAGAITPIGRIDFAPSALRFFSNDPSHSTTRYAGLGEPAGRRPIVTVASVS